MRKAMGVFVIAILIGAPFSMAHAGGRYILRFNHVLGPSHPSHAGLLKWANRV